jgi:hypothetical protein
MEGAMTAFLIELQNKPGELARVTEAIATKRVNITGVSGSTCGDSGRVAIMTADPTGTRSALTDAKIAFKELEATETSLANEPGSLAKAARRLADAGVNIESIMPVGMSGNNVSVAFITDNPAKARETLSYAGATSR